MIFIIYPIILVFLLILFILFTAIGLTFKLKVFSLGEKKEFQGMFTVKWLLFSHTFSIKEPEEKEAAFEEPEDLQKTEHYMEVEKSRDIEEKKPEEKIEYIEGKESTLTKEKSENKEKTGLIDGIRGKKRIKEEIKAEPEEGITTREILHWGLEAFKSLRKPLFRLFSDLLKGIKIRRLESYITFGLSDPADTGILCGFIHSIAGLIYSRCRHCSFSISPVFMCTGLDLRESGEIRVRIHSLIFPFIKFILNGKTLSFTYSIAKEILQRKWNSRWKPKLESKWKFKRKSNSEAL